MPKKNDIFIDLEREMKSENVPGMGVAVFSHGQIIWQKGFGVLEKGKARPVKVNTVFHACSISKMFTAAGALRLVQEGRLGLEDDVNGYMRSWKLQDNEYTADTKVTLLHLLSHQAGFIDPEGSFDVLSKQEQPPAMNDILSGQTRFLQEPLQSSCNPGSRFSYSDAGYCLVGHLIEEVTGMPFSTAMNRLVLQPLGLQRSLFWNIYNVKKPRGTSAGHDPHGTTVKGKYPFYPYPAAAGLWSTPGELAEFVVRLLAAGAGGRDFILNPEFARLMLSAHGCSEEAGLGVFVPRDAKGQVYLVSQGWGIGFQCKVYAFPAEGSGVVVMMNCDPGKPQNESLVGKIINKIGGRKGWPSCQPM